MGNVNYAARFTFNHHVAANAQGSDINRFAHTLTNRLILINAFGTTLIYSYASRYFFAKTLFVLGLFVCAQGYPIGGKSIYNLSIQFVDTVDRTHAVKKGGVMGKETSPLKALI